MVRGAAINGCCVDDFDGILKDLENGGGIGYENMGIRAFLSVCYCLY